MPSETTKKCPKCERIKDRSEFTVVNKERGWVNSPCKPCASKISTRNYHANKEKHRERHKDWYWNRGGKEHRRKQRRTLEGQKPRRLEAWKRQGINLTWEEFKDLHEKQNGKCAICEAQEEELERLLAVDHDHDTGEVRGLICGPCNLFIGHLELHRSNLEQALNYISKNKTKDDE